MLDGRKVMAQSAVNKNCTVSAPHNACSDLFKWRWHNCISRNVLKATEAEAQADRSILCLIIGKKKKKIGNAAVEIQGRDESK